MGRSSDFHYLCMSSVPSEGDDGLKTVSSLFGKSVCRHMIGTVATALKIFFCYLEEGSFCRGTIRRVFSTSVFSIGESLLKPFQFYMR